MPPKSRKRNKGKERKAKKEAIKAQKEREQSYMLWRKLLVLVGLSPGLFAHEYCHHGLCGQAFQQNTPLLPDDHPVSIFMDRRIVWRGW